MNQRAAALRVVLFDFDGTLVNTTPLILRCFRATWRQVFGLECADAEYIQTFGIPLQTAMEQMLARLAEAGRLSAPPDVAAQAAELVRVYRAFNEIWHDEMIQPFAGVDETLRELKARGYRLGVVTSKKRAGVERGLRLYEMAELFDLSLCAEDTANNKPHPEPLLRALAMLEAAPIETLYLGDSIHDIAAGRAAEVMTAAAAWGPFPRAELEALAPHYLLDEPGELLTICPPPLAAASRDD
jgi:pyrophosphatase PpaX